MRRCRASCIADHCNRNPNPRGRSYSGVASLFIRVLLDKKYALPHKVLDALMAHFIETSHDDRQLPVLWHQSVLTFAQRYKGDLTDKDREELKLVLRRQEHGEITAEIRREIFS